MMWRLPIYLTVLLACVSLNIRAQNLVPNSGFEDFTQCPDNSGQILYSTDWYSPTTGSPDYYNTCSSSIYSSVPNNFQGFQSPHTGNGYTGIGVMSTPNNYREYIQCKLSSKLVSGKYYCVSYYVSVNENFINYFIKNIDCLFSNDSVTDFNNFYPVLNYTPQITSSLIINDSISWTQIEGVYLAQGGEQYLTLGNFRDNNNTEYIQVNNEPGWGCAFYIDDVSVYECDSLIGVDENPTNTITIYPNPAKDYFIVDVGKLNNTQIELYDISGRKLLKHKITTNTEQVNVSHLANGVYLAVVSNSGQVVKREKIIVSR